jgi:hypothetical protein
MEAHNANTNLVQPHFYSGEYVLRAVSKMRQHKLSITWKGRYVVEKVYANHTLRLRSLIQDVTFISHVTRARIYRNVDHDLQGMSAMRLTAEHNHFIPYVASKFGRVSIEKKTGDTFVFTEWVGFDSEEGTMEPLYEKWVVVPRLLTEHLHTRADAGNELAQTVLIKIAEFENEMGDHRPGHPG